MMSIQVPRRRSAQPVLRPPADHEAARLLALLLRDGDAGLTVFEIQERGIEAPAQALYALQLAGYEIERTPLLCHDGHSVVRYRVRVPLVAISRRTESKVGDDGL